MKETVEIDVTIIGGGIVGLFTAWKLSEKYKNITICLFEKSEYLGDHSTGRNSGVLHAGLYYDYDSLKHRYCIAGNKFWNKFSSQFNVDIKQVGKYIFGNNEKDIEELYEKAVKNGVTGLSRRPISEISSYVNSKFCFFSKTTSIINVPQAVKVLEKLFTNNDGIIVNSRKVDNILNLDKFIIDFSDYQIKSSILINTAGHDAINIRNLLGLNNLSNLYVKGDYLATTQKLKYPCLLYPLPEKNLKGLGIHSNIGFDETTRFGPDTNIVQESLYNSNDENITLIKNDISKNFKNINLEKLHYDFSGIRSKIKLNGKEYNDFWISSPITNYIEACGIDSPGLTGAPAISEMILDLINL